MINNSPLFSPLKKFAKTPDGNTILHVVGMPLFNAINVRKKDIYDKGVAEAIKGLSDVFLSKNYHNFQSNYLALYYRGLEEGLLRNHYLIDVIISTCYQNLFKKELPGCNSLIPAFFRGIQVILSHDGQKKVMTGITTPLPTLRGYAVKLLSKRDKLSWICSLTDQVN